MYDLDIKEEADNIFKKLSKKNPKQLEIIDKKIQEVRLNPNHVYKFLRKPLQNFNRVHIDKSFVLIFRFDKNKNVISFEDFDHHDKIYLKRN